MNPLYYSKYKTPEMKIISVIIFLFIVHLFWLKKDKKKNNLLITATIFFKSEFWLTQQIASFVS